jgi:hypothetical protein
VPVMVGVPEMVALGPLLEVIEIPGGRLPGLTLQSTPAVLTAVELI